MKMLEDNTVSELEKIYQNLIDKLAEEYFTLHKDIIANVDLKVYGEDAASEEFASKDAYAELAERAEKYAKENEIAYTEATKHILATDDKLATQIQKLEDENSPNA